MNDKVLERRQEFLDKGWTQEHLERLSFTLRPHQDIARIFPFLVELLSRPDGRGDRATLHSWRGGLPYTELCRIHGKDVRPPELRHLVSKKHSKPTKETQKVV